MAALGGKAGKFGVLVFISFVYVMTCSSCNKGPEALFICELQGSGFISPYLDKQVLVSGVVSADLEEQIPGGFFIQEEHCPVENGGSLGVFIQNEDHIDLVDLGDQVIVKGLVQEVAGETRIFSDAASIEIQTLENQLPKIVNLSQMFYANPGPLMYENLEGMLLALPRANVLSTVTGIKVIPQFDLNPSLQMVCLQDESVLLDLRTVLDNQRFEAIADGDLIQQVIGVLRQNLNGYSLHLTDLSDFQIESPVVQPENRNFSTSVILGLETPTETVLIVNSSSTPEENSTPTLEPVSTIIPSPTYYPIHLLITELYPNPTSKEPDGEWIEIYNPENFGLPLNGIKIGDEVSPGGKEGMLRFPDGYTIGARDVLVIANQAATFLSIYGFLPDFEIKDSDPRIPDLLPYDSWGRSSIQFSNGGDQVLLVDPWDRIVDLLAYGSSTALGFSAPPPAPQEGHTLERYPPEQDHDRGGDWREKKEGSPGWLDRSLSTQQATLTPEMTVTLTPTPTPTSTTTTTLNSTPTDPLPATSTLTPSPERTPGETSTVEGILTNTPISSFTPVTTVVETPMMTITWTPTIELSNTVSPTLSGTTALFPSISPTLTPSQTLSVTPVLTETPDITPPSCTDEGSETPTPGESLSTTPQMTATLTITLTSSPPPRSSTPTGTGDVIDIIINEIHADPDSLNGDANGDGLVHSDDDEFLELVNIGVNLIDLSDWVIQDALRDRYTFPLGTTLKSGCGLLVFGGGEPVGDFGGSLIFTAGSLSLNNSGDVLSLRDDQGIAQIVLSYGPEGGQNQSLTRYPDLAETLPLFLHSEILEASGALFSPGVKLDGFSFGVCP